MKKLIGFFSLLILVSCVKATSKAPVEEHLPDVSSGEERTNVLIYGGPGSWKAEIESLKKILLENHATYEVLTAQELNEMSQEDYSNYDAILFAGGDAPTVRAALDKETRIQIREAVQKMGLSYLGFCAGAWLAVAPKPEPGEDVAYGLGVVEGPLLEPNFLTGEGKLFALDRALFADGTERNLLWYGGPVTYQNPGTVVVKYSDGTPAISQVESGQGLVIMSGLHPAANKLILGQIGIYNKEAIAPEIAWALLEAAIAKKKLSTF
ncbi:MAG: BPL-N domain-containing protein [Pseudobdellovibrionaceae bacterium]